MNHDGKTMTYPGHVRIRRGHVSAGHRQRGFLSSRQALVLLMLIFLAPVFVAWIMHYAGERPSGTTNHGILVHPARPLTLPADIMNGERTLNDYLRGKWTLLYIGDTDCNAVCSNNLYKMRQTRLAQNENMRRVQRLYLAEGATLPAELADLLDREYPGMTVVTLSAERLRRITADFAVDDVPVVDADRIYIVDPLGNLMMYYQPDADARGLLKDLQKLLKYSKIG
jgi:cytochrome oxidase Cu insertion factor (SCO1/SenC/PrrC family)